MNSKQNDKVLGSEDMVNKEVTTNQAMAEADRRAHWYLNDEQYQACVEKAKAVKFRKRAVEIMNTLSDQSAEYSRCSALLHESLRGGLRIRTREEVEMMTPSEKRVYYACRDEEVYKYINPKDAALSPDIRPLVLKKEETDGWPHYFIPSKAQLGAVKRIVLGEVRAIDIVDKAQRYPEFKRGLKEYERKHLYQVPSDNTQSSMPPARSLCHVSLHHAYCCFPISTVRKYIYQVCIDPDFNTRDNLELDKDETARLDSLILSQFGGNGSLDKLPVRYDLLREMKTATPFRVELDNEYMLKLLLIKDEEQSPKSAFKTTIRPMLGNVRVSMELSNAPDKEEGNPRLHNSIACLPLYARYHALEHVFKLDMLEVYFPMGDLQLLARAAKCANLLNAMRRVLKADMNAEEITPTDLVKELFDCARDLYRGKDVHQDKLRGLVVAVMNSAYEADMAAAKKPEASDEERARGVTAEESLAYAGEEANRLYQACKQRKLYDCPDFVLATAEFCKKRCECIYAHDRVYVPKEDQQALTILKMDLNALDLIWAVKGRSGSLTSEFDVDYEYFDTNRGEEKQDVVQEVRRILLASDRSGKEYWLNSLLEAS